MQWFLLKDLTKVFRIIFPKHLCQIFEGKHTTPVTKSTIIQVAPGPRCTGVKVQTILSSSMFNVKTNAASDIEFLHTGANEHARTANAQVCRRQPARVSSAAAHSYLCQDLFRLFFDLMLVHLQKVLFTADEAHRASHPSEARAHTHTSKPIQKAPSAARFSLRPPALAPLPQQRRSDGLIPLTWATNARS